MYFVYDSYHVAAEDWARVFKGARSGLPGIFIGLWLEASHGEDIAAGGFHGWYTYFASANFVFGSSPRRWPAMVADANRRGLLSVLSVGPGYEDTGIRPWNAHHSQPRRAGAYYDELWRAALDAAPDAMSVTSYNELLRNFALDSFEL